MARVIAGMVMSLDGFVAGRNGDLSRLYPDMAAMRDSEAVQEAIRATGSVVMGRRSYAMGNGDFTGYEFQVPIFVVTHEVPAEPADGQNDRLSFTFVPEGVERAISLAKRAAGDRDVTVVGGPDVIRQGIAAGLVDELHIDLRAVLLGDGLRMFDAPEGGASPNTPSAPIDLEQVGLATSPGVIHLRYRVVRPAG